MGTISQSQNVLYNLPGIGLSVCDGGGELSINYNAFLEGWNDNSQSCFHAVCTV